MFHNVHVHGTI